MRNILYIHGLNSDKNSYTGNKLKELFPEYNWTLATFDLVNAEETIQQIIKILVKEQIDTVVSSSLGCIYNLFLKKKRNCDIPVVNKILINPCCFPSKELPKMQSMSPLALEYCEALEFNIYHRHEDNSFKNLFGIFSRNDELLHYHDFFMLQYGSADGSNCIWVEGGHAHLAEDVLKDSMRKAVAYFARMEKEYPAQCSNKENNNLADPSKPYHNPNLAHKPVLYIDMDGTMVDFESGAARLDPLTKLKYNGCIDEAPKVFSMMDPIPGAIEAFYKLAEHFDVYILTTAPWLNMTAADDKKAWVQRYFGTSKTSPAYKRLIISHRKELNQGEFLIDDRPYKCGADKFQGTVIPFGPANKLFPDWNSVLAYLLPET